MTNSSNHRADRRDTERLTTLEWAQILFPDEITCASCAILNISNQGALIQIDPTEELPREFWLLRDEGPTTTPCTTRWRIGGQIGVMFIASLGTDTENSQWLFSRDDARRPKEIRSPFLRHPLVIS